MAAQNVITLRGRRLVAGGVTDPAELRVMAVRDLAAAMTIAFGAALLLALAAAPLLVHGPALICPPAAAVGGAVWSYISVKRRVRRPGAQLPVLPSTAIVTSVGQTTLMQVLGISIAAGVWTGLIAGAGRGSPLSLTAAASVPPLLYGRQLGEAMIVLVNAVRNRSKHGRVLFQARVAGKRERAQLYVVPETHAG